MFPALREIATTTLEERSRITCSEKDSRHFSVAFSRCCFRPSQEDSTRFQGNLREAEELYHRARYSASLSRFEAHPTDPASLFLLGRDYYRLGDFQKATQYLKKAVVAAPKNSEYVDWLGRAYGKRADTSNPLSGVLLERKARRAFKRALRLDPKNAEALSDLFLYHLDAPVVLGVGFGKAASMAEERAVDSAEAFLEEWKLPPKRNRFLTAGQTPRRLVALEPKDVGTLVTSLRSQ